MLDITKLWSAKYLFGPNPDLLSRSDYLTLWIGLFFLVAAVIFKVVVFKKDRQSPARFLYSRFFHLFLTMGILTLAWFGLRYENIPWLSSHIVELIILLVGAFWLGFIIRYAIGSYQDQIHQWKDNEQKQKYLK